MRPGARGGTTSPARVNAARAARPPLSRRNLLCWCGALVPLALGVGRRARAGAGSPGPAPTAPDPLAGLTVLTRAKWQTLAHVADTILPATDGAPSAVEAGVLRYIHRCLGGATPGRPPREGSGAGPGGKPPPGAIDRRRADLYEALVARVDALAREGHGRPFSALTADERGAIVARLSKGARADVGYRVGGVTVRGGMSDRELYELIRRRMIEGYFADPTHGGNAGHRAWESIGHICHYNYPREHACDAARRQHR